MWLEQWYLSFEWSKGEELPDAVLADLKEDAWKQLRQAMTGGRYTMPTGSPQKPAQMVVLRAAASVINRRFILFHQRRKAGA